MNVSPQRLWWSRRLTPAALICLSLTGALLPAQAALSGAGARGEAG